MTNDIFKPTLLCSTAVSWFKSVLNYALVNCNLMNNHSGILTSGSNSKTRNNSRSECSDSEVSHITVPNAASLLG